jgi:hypothetical protein
MSANTTPPNGVINNPQQSPTDDKQQYDATITEKTRGAIAAQDAPSSKSNESDPPKPTRGKPKIARAMCRMFFPSSGRMGFGQVMDSAESPPLETLRHMITYETRLRLSDSIQELMDVYHTDEESVTCVSLRSFG